MAGSSLRKMASTVALILSLWSGQIYASIEDPSISPTPPMGFNNWARQDLPYQRMRVAPSWLIFMDRFECALNESLFVETADAMATNGLLDAGFKFVF